VPMFEVKFLPDRSDRACPERLAKVATIGVDVPTRERDYFDRFVLFCFCYLGPSGPHHRISLKLAI